MQSARFKQIPLGELIPMLHAVADRNWEAFRELEEQFVKEYGFLVWEDFLVCRVRPTLDKESDLWFVSKWLNEWSNAEWHILASKIGQVETDIRKLKPDVTGLVPAIKELKLDIQEIAVIFQAIDTKTTEIKHLVRKIYGKG